MKLLKGFLASIVGLLIFILIFCLFVSFAAQSFIKNDLLKNTALDAIEKNDSSKELVKQHKEVIEKMFDDGESTSIINMVVDNYLKYKDNRASYSVPKDDVKKLYNFVLKYKNEIKDMSGQDISKMSEKEFEEFFDQEEVNKMALDTFGEFDESLDNKVVDIGLKIYSIATSTTVRVIAVIAIIVLIVLWCLLKGELIKSILSIGLDFILVGIVMIAIYFIVNMFKNSMIKDSLKMTKEINLSSFLTAGIISILIGAVLIIAFIVIKKSKDKKQQEAINNIQPIDYNAVQVSTEPFNAAAPSSEVPAPVPTEQAPVPSPEPQQESNTESQVNQNEGNINQ